MSISKNYVSYSSRTGLYDSDVMDIRLLAAKKSIRNIASSLGIPKSTIHDIVIGKTWSHVPTPKILNQLKNYTIFADGRVWSNRTSKFLSPKMDKLGHVNVELIIDGKRQAHSVALLVAKAFLGKKGNKISFRDKDVSNVHFTNILTK